MITNFIFQNGSEDLWTSSILTSNLKETRANERTRSTSDKTSTKRILEIKDCFNCHLCKRLLRQKRSTANLRE